MPNGILQCLLSLGRSSSGFILHHTFKPFHQSSQGSSWKLKSCIPTSLHLTCTDISLHLSPAFPLHCTHLYWHLTASQSPNPETDVFFYKSSLTLPLLIKWPWSLSAPREDSDDDSGPVTDASTSDGQVLLFSSCEDPRHMEVNNFLEIKVLI